MGVGGGTAALAAAGWPITAVPLAEGPGQGLVFSGPTRMLITESGSGAAGRAGQRPAVELQLPDSKTQPRSG